MKKFLYILLIFALSAVVFSACANPAPPQTEASQNENTSTAPSEAQPSEAAAETPPQDEAAWPRTIVDGAGNAVVLEKQPQKIALLHSMYLEYFFGLGTPPTASAGANVGTAMKALETFATLKPFLGTADIIDLGSAREINIEAVLEASPDVIVTFNGHGGIDQIYDQLTEIAPVILLDYTATWQDATMDCAEIVGKEEVAQKLIEETEAIVADARDQLLPFRDKTAIFVRSDGTGGIFAMGFDRYPYYYDTETGFGLSKPEGYPGEWGVISLESLASLDPDYIFFQDFEDDAQAAVDAQESSVWQSLTAVKNNQVFYFDVSINTTSALSLQVLAESLIDAMVK